MLTLHLLHHLKRVLCVCSDSLVSPISDQKEKQFQFKNLMCDIKIAGTIITLDKRFIMSLDISRTTLGIAAGIAGTIFLSYCIYFDKKRRSDPEYKKKVRERK